MIGENVNRIRDPLTWIIEDVFRLKKTKRFLRYSSDFAINWSGGRSCRGLLIHAPRSANPASYHVLTRQEKLVNYLEGKQADMKCSTFI